MTLEDAENDYIAFARHEKGLSTRSTCIQYRSWLRYFRRWLADQGHARPGLASLSAATLRRYLYFLSAEKKYRPRTIRGAFHPIRGLCAYLVSNGALPEDTSRQIILPKRDAATRLLVSDEECANLLAACDRLPSDPRRRKLARAILSVVIYAGVRSDELEHLRTVDYSRESGTLLVAHGKGEKSRLLYPPPPCREALEEWLFVRGEADHDWLWMFDKSRKYKDNGLRSLLEDVKSVAGYGGAANIKFHSIRHRFATRIMEGGASIKQVQSCLGHAHPTTTFTYLHLQEEGAKVMAQMPDIASGKTEPACPKPQATSVEAPRRHAAYRQRRSAR